MQGWRRSQPVLNRRYRHRERVDPFFLIYPALGLLSGVLAGLLGIGGGLVLVPALLFILPRDGVAAEVAPHVAIATSLATVIVTSLAATWSQHLRGAVRWDLVRRMGAGLALGAFAGAFVADLLPGTVLRMGFGLFALWAAFGMIRGRLAQRRGALPGTPGFASVGLLIGHISALVGIGGGTMTVPFLHWRGLPLQQAVATSSACGLAIALGGTLGYALQHHASGGLMLGYVHGPAALGIGLASLVAAPLGVRMAHRLSTRMLTRIFALLLALVAIRLLIP